MDTGSNFVDEKPIINSAGNVASSLTSMSVELCLVCGDRASGRHYGAISCEGCKGFFKRSIRKQLGYQCRGTMSCEVTKHHRNRCQFCRLQKCLASGMRSDSVQHERKPISDKKEIQTSIATSLTVQSSSTSSYQKSKLFSHQNSSIIASPGSISENLASVFPVGFNFADLTQTLSKRALLAPATYQQQQISQQDNFLYSPGTQTNDDDSIDYSVGGGISGGENANSTGNVSENIQSTKTAIGASVITAGLIQSSISKNVISQSLELVTGIPQYYERNNSKNNIERIDIVKEEMTDEHTRHDSDDAEEEQVIFEIPILPEGNVSFNLQTPTLVPSYFNAHYVCESGSRLLFLSVYWIKKNHAFQQLSEDIQISLLRHHWVKLFAVGLSQCCRLLSMSTIMSALVTNILQISETEKVLPSKIRKLSEHTCQLHEFVQTLQTMDLDEHEYAYVRLLLIFSPDSLNVKDFGKRRYIERLHEYALSCFRNYLVDNHPGPDFRCTKILLKLMPLWSLESDVVEELFFSNLIGQVQIESMIPYILKLGGGGV